MTHALTTDARFNKYHVPAGSSNGGQFGSSSDGQTAQQKLSGMKEPSGGGKGGRKSNPWRNGVMAYDPKTKQGPGYDWPDGNPDVKTLQTALNRLGLLDDSGKPLAVDGRLGPLTTQAIKKAQKALGLKQDGQVTHELFIKLAALKTLPKPAKAHAVHKHRSEWSDQMDETRALPPDPHADAHNAADATFLHNMLGSLQGSANHAKAVITEGKHPDVKAAARDIVATHGQQLTAMKGIAARLGVSTAAAASSSSSGPAGQGGGNAYGRSIEMRSADKTPYGNVTYADPGYQADGVKRYPLDSAEHCRAAWSYINQTKNATKYSPQHLAEIKDRIVAAAKKYGITINDHDGDEGPMRFRLLGVCVRDFGFEFETRSDGRTLEGYAAVFNTPATIRDVGGDFEETILPGAFKRSLAERMPIMQWDHGKDPRVGTVPIAAIQDLGEDSRGVHVRARLFDNDVVEPVRQAIEARAIRGMSFRFGVPKGGDDWPTRDQRHVRDLDAYELGPVAFPAYDATSVSVRSLIAQLDPDEHRSLIRELAAELRRVPDLSDLTGRPGAWSAGGGDADDQPGHGSASTETIRSRFAHDDESLRLRGILR